MIFKIDPEVFKKFPKLNIGVLIVSGMDNTGSDEKIFHLLEEVKNLIELEFTSEKMIDIEHIKKKVAKHKLISNWRAAYEELGHKPEKVKTSVEALIEGILTGKKYKKGNKLMDCMKYLTLKHMVPIGVIDLDKIKGDVSLGMHKKYVVYYDGKSPVSVKWNWKTNNRVKVSEDTKNAILFYDGLPPVGESKLKKVIEDTIEVIGMFCGGKSISKVLNIKQSSIKIS